VALQMKLCTRQGETLGVTGEAADTIDATLPAVSASRFPLLVGLSRFEDTMFNRVQMDYLAKELERLLPDAPSRRAGLINELIRLCQVGADMPDAQFWFIAD